MKMYFQYDSNFGGKGDPDKFKHIDILKDSYTHIYFRNINTCIY